MRRRREAKARPQRERQRERGEDVPEREFQIDVPNDPKNEQIILAAMMVDESTCDRLLGIFPVDAFYAEEHKLIRAGLEKMRRQKLSFDPAVLCRLAPDVDPRIVEQLPLARPELPPNLEHHIETLQWDWRRATIANGPFATLLEDIQDENAPREKLRAVARQLADAFDGREGRGRFLRDPKTVVQEMMDRLRARANGEVHYRYGIDGLDFFEDGTRRMRPGAAPGAMTLVTALSGSGKSTLMAHLAIALARQKQRVLFGAWEEVAPVTLELITTLVLKWSRSRVLDGKSNKLRTGDDTDWAPMTHEDLVIFEDTADRISKWVTFFDNPFDHGSKHTRVEPSNEAHLDIIEEHILDSGCNVFFADLLHRCLVDDSPSDEKRFLNRFLAINQDAKIHTIAAHQQRAKDIETRANKQPTREGIIGAGAWLDVFWTVLAPHLPAKWKDVPDDVLQIFILKQRNGAWPLGIEFAYDADTGQISGGRDFAVKTTAETSDPAFGPKKGSKPKRPFSRR